MRRRLRRLLELSLVLWMGGVGGRGLRAQDTALVADSGFVEVDRIVAIVGDVAIPFSRVQEQVNMRRARGQPVPSDSGQLRALWREIVESIVDEELVVQEAQRDTAIVIDDAQLQEAVDQTVRQVRQQFRSELEYERQLRASGFGSVEEYRRWITDQRRREMLQEALMRRLREKDALKPIQPTQQEINEYYQRVITEQPGERPASVSFRQIVIRPLPDSAALVAAFRLADSLAREIRGGADFAVLARRFSQDPGSRDQGGELGWFRRGRMVREFEDVAFALRPGYVSNPVRTPYGFHLIQVQRAEPAEVQARHILITPEITDANVAEARARADSVVAALRRGAPFDSLHRLLHDPTEEAFAQDVPRDSLPPEYRTALEGRMPGDIVGPIELERSEGGSRYAVVLFESERAAGPLTLEEVRDRIRANLAQDNALRRYLRELRRRTYVEIRL